MRHFGMVVSPGAYLTSVGSMVDSCALAMDRRRHLLHETDDKVPEMSLSVMSVDGERVRVGGGLFFEVIGSIALSDHFDFVWLPAFRFGGIDPMRQRLASSRKLIRWLQDQAASGAVLGASGASAMFLVEAGLLEGKSVPFSQAMLSVVREIFPRCQAHYHDQVADYGNILVTNGIANELALIAEAMGRVISPDSSRWLAAVTGLYRADETHLISDPLVAMAKMTIEYQYMTDLSIGDMAKELSTTHQSLIRRFKEVVGVTPHIYVQQLRLLAAQRMLSDSRRSIDEIARVVGYADARAFREMFRKHTGETASAWRQARRSRRNIIR